MAHELYLDFEKRSRNKDKNAFTSIVSSVAELGPSPGSEVPNAALSTPVLSSRTDQSVRPNLPDYLFIESALLLPGESGKHRSFLRKSLDLTPIINPLASLQCPSRVTLVSGSPRETRSDHGFVSTSFSLSHGSSAVRSVASKWNARNKTEKCGFFSYEHKDAHEIWTLPLVT